MKFTIFLTDILDSRYLTRVSLLIEIPIVTSLNLTIALANNDVVLLEFVSSNCPRCSYLEKTLHETMKMIDNIQIQYNKTLLIAKIDVGSSEAISHQYSIYKFPSLLLLQKKYETRYEYAFDTDDISVNKIVKFIEK